MSYQRQGVFIAYIPMWNCGLSFVVESFSEEKSYSKMIACVISFFVEK